MPILKVGIENGVVVPSSPVTADPRAESASPLSPDGEIEVGRDTRSHLVDFDMTVLRRGSADEA